jgi:hypothetical protein
MFLHLTFFRKAADLVAMPMRDVAVVRTNVIEINRNHSQKEKKKQKHSAGMTT